MVGSPADMNHAARRLNESRLANMMARLFLLHHGANDAEQFIIGRAALHRAIKIMIQKRKQAGANLAVGCDANARAVPAERMRDRRDDPNLSHTVFEGVATSSFTGRMLRQRLDGLEL